MMSGSHAALLVLVVITGCAPPVIAQSGETHNGEEILSDSGIALLNHDLDARVAQKMTDCITSEVTKQSSGTKVTDAQQA